MTEESKDIITGVVKLVLLFICVALALHSYLKPAEPVIDHPEVTIQHITTSTGIECIRLIQGTKDLGVSCNWDELKGKNNG